ncbi:MAG: phospholipase D-like domain-containing protein [Bdellovibrionota bacterium]
MSSLNYPRFSVRSFKPILPFFSFAFFFCSIALAKTTEVQIVPDQNALPAILNLLDEAKTSVELLQFSFVIDNGKGTIDTRLSTGKIVQKLIDLKKKRGAHFKIRLYIEGTRDTAPRNEITAAYLRANGIEVRFGSTHAKAIIVDGSSVFVGSTNLTNQSLERNNETNIVVKNSLEIAGGIKNYFELLWNKTPRTPQVFPDSPTPEGLQVYTDQAYKKLLLETIHSAQKTLDFSIYYFNEADIEQALIEAHKRGVQIRGYVNHHKTFALELVKRNKETVARLNAAGLSSLYFDRDAFFSHSKYIVADSNTIVLGTGNWNSTDIKTHPQLYVKLTDPELATALSQHLSQQVAYESDRPAATMPYHRFWIGWKRPEITQEVFDRAIDQAFIDATIVAGAHRGLIGYQPVLVQNGGSAIERNGRSFVVPDELALVSYQDRESYRAAREAELGKEYGPLHGEIFFIKSGDPLNSHSAEPQGYSGSVEITKAYDLSSPKNDWQKGQGYFSLTLRSHDLSVNDSSYTEAIRDYLSSAQQYLGSKSFEGYVVLVERDYLVEYFNAETTEELRKLTQALSQLKSATKILDSQALHEGSIQTQAFGQTKIARNPEQAAIRVSFPRDLKPEAIMKQSLEVFERTPAKQRERQTEIRSHMRAGRADPRFKAFFAQWLTCEKLLSKTKL